MRRNTHVNFKENDNSVYIRDVPRKLRDDSQTENPDKPPVHVGDYFPFGIIIGLVACLIEVIAVAIPWWAYFTRVSFGTVVQTNSGLWVGCREYTEFDGEFSSSCSKVVEPEDYILNTRLGNMIGLTLVGLGIIVSLVYRFWYTDLHLLILIGGLLLNIAGVMTWATAINYSVKFLENNTQSPSEVHACWYLSLFAGFMYHVVSFLVVFKRDHTTAAVRPTR